MADPRKEYPQFEFEKVNLLQDIIGRDNILPIIGCGRTWFDKFYKPRLLEYGAIHYKILGGRKYLAMTPYLFMKWRQEENLRRFKEDFYYDERTKRFKQKVRPNRRKRKPKTRNWRTRKIKTVIS